MAFAELITGGGPPNDALMLNGAAQDRNLMREPVPIDLAECERAAVDLHLGAQIILHYRTPGLERLRSQFAIFLGFSGATDATREDARHTLQYRLIDDAQAFQSLNC